MPAIHPWQSDATSDLVIKHLRDGRCVVLPTETAYELVGSALHAEAVDQVRAMTSAEQMPAIVLGDYANLFDWLPLLRGAGPRILRKTAVRPLTLLADAGYKQGLWRHLPEAAQRTVTRDDQLAVRWSGHEFWDELRSFELPLVSIPLAGAFDAASAAERVGERAACVIDGGPARIAALPSIVQAVGRRCRTLHEAALTSQQLDDLARCRIVFLCTGNTCRSPMAQALCAKLLAEELGEAWRQRYAVASAGLWVVSGMEASPDAVRVAADFGADLSSHRSQPLSTELFLGADHLFCMTVSHLAAFAGHGPNPRTVEPRLLSPSGDDVPDPIGGELADYRTCAEQIIQYLRQRLPELLES